MKIEQDRYWLVARDKPSLLTRMMQLLAGDAEISFEGKLSDCKFPDSIPVIPENLSVLRRQTVSPVQDFIVLKLEHDTVRPILDAILPGNRFMEDIIHIQIAQHGSKQFGSYDQFHHECIVCFLGVPIKFLDELKQRGIIISWTTPHANARRGGHG
jgi:hypothetical protein